MKLFLFLALLGICFGCTQDNEPNAGIIQSDDYVLVEFAAKLEEAEHAQKQKDKSR